MISIIIPTLNEKITIKKLVQYLQSSSSAYLIGEIIVVDGGSNDGTIAIANSMNVRVIQTARKGRAVQMNAGAAIAREPILYFLHSDTFPPHSFTTQIVKAIKEGYISGCYHLQFDIRHWFL